MIIPIKRMDLAFYDKKTTVLEAPWNIDQLG